MLFSQELWQRNLNLYQKILDLPFNQELANGTLDKEAFCHYVIQDAQYLVAYGRVLAVAAAKAFDADDIMQFSDAAKIAIVVERSLHDDFMKNFGVTKDIVNKSIPNNPYQAWIDTYAGEEFHTAVRNVIATVDKVAARCDADTLEKMHAAYTMGAKLEWLFWDSAYHQRQWLGLDQI